MHFATQNTLEGGNSCRLSRNTKRGIRGGGDGTAETVTLTVAKPTAKVMKWTAAIMALLDVGVGQGFQGGMGVVDLLHSCEMDDPGTCGPVPTKR